MRLNGWQRIGIVASVVWVVFAFVHVGNEKAARQNQWFHVTYDLCAERELAQTDCFAVAKKSANEVHPQEIDRYDVLQIAVTVLAGW